MEIVETETRIPVSSGVKDTDLQLVTCRSFLTPILILPTWARPVEQDMNMVGPQGPIREQGAWHDAEGAHGTRARQSRCRNQWDSAPAGSDRAVSRGGPLAKRRALLFHMNGASSPQPVLRERDFNGTPKKRRWRGSRR